MLTKSTDWLVSQLNRFLSSKTGLFIALIVPLAVIPLPEGIKNVENILSSNWTQLWALFVLGIIQAKHGEHLKKIHEHNQKMENHVFNLVKDVRQEVARSHPERK